MSSDHQFGPKLRAAFDFTLTFDYSILNILPCCLLILAAPLFISYYGHKQPVIHPGALLWTKLVSSAKHLCYWFTSVVVSS